MMETEIHCRVSLPEAPYKLLAVKLGVAEKIIKYRVISSRI
jgi:hypothetical protein